MESTVETFETGATRSSETEKLDYEGALSPLVLRRYVTYIGEHTLQANGSRRPFDNWKKGMPIIRYMKGKWRHFMDTWLCIKGYSDKDVENFLCAEMFNTMGMLHEILKEKEAKNAIPYSGQAQADSEEIHQTQS